MNTSKNMLLKIISRDKCASNSQFLENEQTHVYAKPIKEI